MTGAVIDVNVDRPSNPPRALGHLVHDLEACRRDSASLGCAYPVGLA